MVITSASEGEGAVENRTVPSFVEKWGNSEYQKSIREYQARRAQHHLIHSMEVASINFFDLTIFHDFFC